MAKKVKFIELDDPEAEQQAWDEEADRHNRLGQIAEKLDVQVGADLPPPPKRNADGTLADVSRRRSSRDGKKGRGK